MSIPTSAFRGQEPTAAQKAAGRRVHPAPGNIFAHAAAILSGPPKLSELGAWIAGCRCLKSKLQNGQGLSLPAREKNISYGYGRCSTNESKQDLGRQVRELKQAGAGEIFIEYEHGDAKVKSQQAQMFAQAQAGDSIIVLEVSRLARSTQQLCEIIDIVREKHLRLVIVGSITLDCRSGQTDPMSEAFLQMAGVFSQLELAMIRSRVRSGMENARAKGKQIGRPQMTVDAIPTVFLRHYPAYQKGQLNLSELARVCGISRTTAYKYLALLK